MRSLRDMEDDENRCPSIAHRPAFSDQTSNTVNNLTDLTLDPVYSSICGYTEGDLDTVFAPELAGLDRERVREWYNGYSWLGTEKVYNPYDVLLLFRRREPPTGSRPARRRSWWTRSSSGGSRRLRSTAR